MNFQDETIMKSVRQERCCFCGSEPPNDAHHLFGRGAGGGMRMDTFWNLAPMCRQCHNKAEAGVIQHDFLCNQVLQHHFWRLQRMPKEKRERFAELMAAYNEFLGAENDGV